MSIGMEVGVFLAYAAGMLLIYVFSNFLLVPFKWLLRLICSSAAGGAVLFLVNLIGSQWGIFVPVNMITAFIAGVLGLPGIAAILIFFI